MDPRPKRKRSPTVTRDSINWKLRNEGDPWAGALDDKQIQRIAVAYDIDEELLRKVADRLGSVLSHELTLVQPEFQPARKEAGQKKIARVNDLMKSAEGKLKEASRILQDLSFSNPFGHVGVPNATVLQIKEFEAARVTLQQCGETFRIVERYEEAQSIGSPDARKARDMRRTITCVTLFNFWLDLERKLTYTTDPVSGERTGPLVEFVNDIVRHMTEPPQRLSGEAIKRELECFWT